MSFVRACATSEVEPGTPLPVNVDGVEVAVVRQGDDLYAIRAVVSAWIADPKVEVVIMTGGTGITRRDVTPEALEPLISKRIDGFGELFRQLSYNDIGASTIQSRAVGAICRQTLVFALPGSTGAVKLAMDKILLPQLDLGPARLRLVDVAPGLDGREHALEVVRCHAALAVERDATALATRVRADRPRGAIPWPCPSRARRRAARSIVGGAGGRGGRPAEA